MIKPEKIIHCVVVLALMAATFAGCVETRVVKDNSVESKLKRGTPSGPHQNTPPSSNGWGNP
jgi:hypothetical protein